MIEEKHRCKNCFYFIDLGKSEGKNYVCNLHKEGAHITDPNSQFCGNEYWVTNKLKNRLSNLEALLNTD